MDVAERTGQIERIVIARRVGEDAAPSAGRRGAVAREPIARFARWFRDAVQAGAPLPEAVALATASPRGRPSVRFVLLKHADRRGFVFFTDGRSRKGRELDANPHAALAVYWNALGRQVRIEGRVARVAPAESDAYWATRPRPSQLAANASLQSAVLPSRAALRARWLRLGRQHRGRPLMRPPDWTGYRLVPAAIEFWTHRAHRLHERELFIRTPRGWRRMLLQP